LSEKFDAKIVYTKIKTTNSKLRYVNHLEIKEGNLFMPAKKNYRIFVFDKKKAKIRTSSVYNLINSVRCLSHYFPKGELAKIPVL